MATGLPDNPDLAWDLEDTIDMDTAKNFVMQFEETLCVYSPSVQQLYSTYNIFFPEEYDRRMVILPDPGAFHDTFNGITTEAITMTGLYVVPGELIGKAGLHLANVDKDRNLSERRIPFESGMRKLMGNRPDDDPFLPVLAKGDLRGFKRDWPVLHMHRIKLGVLEMHSALDLTNIRNVITEKLESLFVAQHEFNA
jgi:hypothetical protein